MTIRVNSCVLPPTDWEKRAVRVGDAAVTWAGKRNDTKEKRWEREVAKGCAER